MFKNIGETALTKIFELIEEKINYLKNRIDNLPTSLPANGGNADTVDNKHIVVSSSAPTSNDTSIITIVI